MNTKDKVKEWDEVLDEYEKGIGLPIYNGGQFSNDELEHYFSMDRKVLETMTPQDCGEIAYRLGQFSFHVQRSINRELARLNWAEENIKEVIADDINNYKGYGYIEKSMQAIKHNDNANALNKIKKYAKMRSDRLQYIANSIKNLSDILLNIQRSKLKHEQ
jgi:hypothetical protein